MIDPSLTKVVDAGRLTDVLRRAGMLADGRVREVVAEPAREMILSRIVRLRLAYEGATEGAPASLILKTRRGDNSGPIAWGEQEVGFYERVATATPPGILPRSFEAVWQNETKDWHLLLEDLTDSHHIATIWPLPPTDAECRTIVATQARFHAAWWDDRRLGVSVGAFLDENARRQHLQRFQDGYRSLADRLGDRLSSERRALYERFFAKPPPLRARHDTRRNLTVIHGDAHVWNCFLPNDAGAAARLFDWDSWRIGTAATDLAYMMALHWYPERRRRLERPLLDHYHDSLLAAGVQGYDRQALDDDYRLAVLTLMMTPVIQASVGIPPVIWWGHLERILLAVDDLGCRDLLG